MSDKEIEKILDDLIDRELLISLVKERPVLWNKFLNIYKDKIGKIAAWQEICVILKKDFDQMEQKDQQLFGKCVMKRWTQIRDAWVKSLQTCKKSKKSGSGFNFVRPYKYDKELSFLKPVVQAGDTQVNVKNNEDSIKKENDCKHIKRGKTKTTDQQKPRLDLPPKKKKGFSEMDAKMLRLIYHQLKQNAKENDDRNFIFFKSILPSLKSFDDDQILEFQSGVINLIQSIKRRPS